MTSASLPAPLCCHASRACAPRAAWVSRVVPLARLVPLPRLSTPGSHCVRVRVEQPQLVTAASLAARALTFDLFVRVCAAVAPEPFARLNFGRFLAPANSSFGPRDSMELNPDELNRLWTTYAPASGDMGPAHLAAIVGCCCHSSSCVQLSSPTCHSALLLWQCRLSLKCMCVACRGV
jgi:hypothetical protein